MFTVNAEGKKVKFAPGNLYWDGSKFCFEDSQLSYPKEWNPNHVGHFYWSKDAVIAISDIFNEDERSEDDILFSANDNAINGWTTLSSDEWQYICENAIAINSEGMYTIWIDDIQCIIIKPDSFTGAIADTYTSEEWGEAEKLGLIALPFVGYRYNSSEIVPDIYWCRYWSCSPNGESYAYVISTDGETDISVNGEIERVNGYPIRLVQEIE